MRIGWLAVVAVLAAAGGVGWWVTTQQGEAPAGETRTAAAPARTAAFDRGETLPATLTPIADRYNRAAMAADAQPIDVTGGSGGAAAAATTTATPASGQAADTLAAADAPPAQNDAAGQATEQRLEGSRADPVLLRAQVMLDRAHFSPGVIDGLGGENTRNALMAFEQARGLEADGRLDPQAFAALSASDANPAVRGYRIAAEDVAGPFVATIPDNYPEMSRLERLGYRDAAEALAEKFHMDEDLLRALNPGADFAAAGTVILVAAVSDDELPAEVDRIEVDKDRVQVRAYADQRLVAVYPATVGSSTFPSPQGSMTVNGVAPAPTYTYNPEVITFGRERNGTEVLTIAAGPNNPVGSTWIDLSEPTYGIHGAPEPQDVGKTASHGCVRLTNWDAAQLGRSVRNGASVTFVGTRTGRA